MNTVSLEDVQKQADILGIEYHHRAGAEKIAGMVAAHLVANPADALKLVPKTAQVLETELLPIPEDVLIAASEDSASAYAKRQPLADAGDPCPVKPLSSAEWHRTEEGQRVKNLNALRRVRITCMNPNKREWPGEIISVGSARHGTFKKFVPFDGRDYHVPKIIYDMLKERKCTLYRTETDARGNDHRVGYQAPEFGIVDLPPLTKAELEDLRKKQQLAKAGL